MTRLASRLYRLLLLLYPVRFRDRVGEDMAECFEDLVDTASRESGARGVWGVGIRTVLELPGSLIEAHREDRKTTRGGTMFESIWRDIRYAARGLTKSPGFTALAVVSLGLGVGANTTMYSMIESTLWTAMDVPEADRMVRVKEIRDRVTEVSYGNYQDLVREVDAFEGALMHSGESFALVSDDISEILFGEIVTSNYFEVLRVDPAVGRFFDATQHEAPESDPVVVLSHHLWTRSFGADTRIIGETVRLNGHPFTVLGVAPESFNGTKFGIGSDLFVPVRQWRFLEGWSQGWEDLRGSRSMLMMARLADGATEETANAALATVASRLAEEYPQQNADMRLRVYPDVAGQIAPEQAGLPNMIGLLAILGSGLVLLVACGNVASLLLARAVARRQEMGVRVALGASRGRIVRQLLTESTMLALMGAAVGTGLAAWASRFDSRMLPNIPYRFVIDTSPDLSTVTFAATASLLAVFVFGLLPALQASKPGISGVLRGSDGSASRRFSGSRLLNGVTVGVVALSFVTLFLAGLFGASLKHVRGLDPAFAQDSRLVAAMDLAFAGYAASEAPDVHRRLIAAAEALPGISEASIATSIPIGDVSSSSRFFADDREYDQDDLGLNAWTSSIGTEWFDVSETRLLAGRSFTDVDDGSSPSVVIVNEALADALWPNEDPIGKRLRYSSQSGAPTLEVVGVVETGKYSSMVEPPKPAAFWPVAQSPGTRGVLLATTVGLPSQSVGPLREAVRAVDPDVVLYDIKTIDEHWQNAFWLFRIGADLGRVIGLLAALLAAGGLYGIMVFRVGQRRREMGIRVALGAGRARVLRHVMQGSMRLVTWGLAIGSVVALATSSVVGSIVFGVEPTSPLRLAGVGLVLTALAALATLAPALGATRADPVEAIKTE